MPVATRGLVQTNSCRVRWHVTRTARVAIGAPGFRQHRPRPDNDEVVDALFEERDADPNASIARTDNQNFGRAHSPAT